MKQYYGAVVAEPQGVTIKDNSTGTWGFGRSPLTSVSLVSDSICDQVIPEIYTDSEMPVNCKVAAGRDESDFYEALGIVGEGPLISYTAAHYEDLNGNPVAMDSTGAVFVGSTLDGQAHHGWPNQPTFGIRQVLGADPAADGDWFSLDQSGNATGGDWRKIFSGNSTYKDNYAAGTEFLVIRRSDTKGLQLTKPGDHAMAAYVQMGMSGWVWTSPGVRVFGPPLVNPVWIAINMLLRARGLRLGANATTAQLNLAETFFDVQAALDAAAICNQQMTALVGAGSETQFKFRGTLQEEKPLRDWLREVLMNCLGYYTFSFGKLKIGVRVNSSTVEAFTIGNIVFNSLQLAPLKPSFDHLTANFADQDYKFVNNSVTVYDIDRATLLGGAAGPLFPEIQCQPLRHLHQVAGGADHQHPAARRVGRHQHRGVEGRAPVGLPHHGPGAQHRAGNGLLDGACGHAGRLGRVPRVLLEAQQGLLHRHSGPHDDGLHVRSGRRPKARRRGGRPGPGRKSPGQRSPRRRPLHANSHRLRDLCRGQHRGPARCFRQYERGGRHRDYPRALFRRRARYRSLGQNR